MVVFGWLTAMILFFFQIARNLTDTQSLTKCRKCNSAAIVDNNISQCQNLNSCGLIYCLLCSSYSETGSKDFKDACGHASLRPKLGNMSNCMEDSSFFNFSNQDSGFYSENESPPKVRRNLFKTNETSKALSICNKNKVVVTYKRKDSITYVPVVANEQKRSQTECDSPPRYGYAIGSKQSKKNLKRLTRQHHVTDYVIRFVFLKRIVFSVFIIPSVKCIFL